MTPEQYAELLHMLKGIASMLLVMQVVLSGILGVLLVKK